VRCSFRGLCSGRSGRADDPAARAFEDDEQDAWLLIHKRDEASVPGWDAEDHPQSVKSGRTNDEVLESRDAIWVSQAPATTGFSRNSGAGDTSIGSGRR